MGQVLNLSLKFLVRKSFECDIIQFIDLCLGGDRVINSYLHIDQREVEVNMIKFTVQ